MNNSTFNRLQSKHCPHKRVNACVSGGKVALIKAEQMLPVNSSITAWLFCLQRSSFSTASSPNGKVYDVPNQPKRASLYNVRMYQSQDNFRWYYLSGLWSDSFIFFLLCYSQNTTPPTPMPRKQVLEKGLNSPETLRCSSPEDSYVSFRCFRGFISTEED